MNAPSFNDLLEIGRTEAKALRPDLKFYDGDVTEAMLHACAAMGDAVMGTTATLNRNLYFAGAKETDLDTVVMDKLGLPREPATQATGVLTFSRGSGPTGNSGTLATGTQIATVVGPDGSRIVVETSADVSVPTGAFSATVPAIAVAYGTSGNVSAGLLTNPVQPLLGGDNTILVTNVEPFAGGNDSETDESYSQRARMLWQTQRAATMRAIEQAALTVDTVRVAIAEENEATGIVTLYVSDQDGNSNGAMLYAVILALKEWRAAGSVINVTGGVKALVTLTVSIDDYERGFDVGAAAQTIIDSVTTRVSRGRVNQDLTIDSLTAAAIMPYATMISEVSFPAISVARAGVSTPLRPDTDIKANGSLIRIEAITVIDGKQTVGRT